MLYTPEPSVEPKSSPEAQSQAQLQAMNQKDLLAALRGRDLVRPSVRLGMLRAGWPRSWGRLIHQPSKEEASWTCTMSCAKQGLA